MPLDCAGRLWALFVRRRLNLWPCAAVCVGLPFRRPVLLCAVQLPEQRRMIDGSLIYICSIDQYHTDHVCCSVAQ